MRRVSTTVILGIGIGVLVGLGCSRAVVTSDATLTATWSQFRGESDRRGVRDARSIRPPLYQVWSRKTGRNPLVEPIVVGDHIVVPTSDRQIRVVERKTGLSGWRRKVAGVPSTGLVAADGRVFVGHGVPNPGLTALSLRDGSVSWIREDVDPRGAPAVHADTLFVTDLRLGLAAFDTETGDTLWTRGSSRRWPAPLALAPGVLVVCDETDSVRAFSTRDGRPLWSASTGGGVRSAPVIVDDVVVVSSVDGVLSRFALADGAMTWREEIGARVYAPLLARDGSLYVATLSSRFIAIDLASGRVVWTVALDGAVRAGPSLAGDIAVVPTMTGACQLVSLEDARVRHTVDLDHAVRAGAIVAGKYIYAVDEGGTLVAYESS